MNGESLLRLHDLDLLLVEFRAVEAAGRRARAVPETPPGLERERARLIGHLDPRWRQHYERAHQRYGAALAPVRSCVCQGCYVSLPRSSAPAPGEAFTMCASCGRILYWPPRAGS
jgi:predicted  nucleic acid-binding Zn-ribbon protein